MEIYLKRLNSLKNIILLQKLNIKALKLIDYYKQHGLLKFIKRILEELGFKRLDRTLIFFKLDMDDIKNDLKEPYSFHIATLDDIKNDNDYDDNNQFTKKQSIYRLLNGHRLFILRDKERIVCFNWIEHKKAAIWWFDNLPLHLDQGIVYMAGGYTLPEFRRKGLFYRLQNEILHYLKNDGVKYAISVIHPSNVGSIKSFNKAGFKEYQKVVYKRYWHIRHYIVHKINSDEQKTFVTLFKSPKYIWKTFF